MSYETELAILLSTLDFGATGRPVVDAYRAGAAAIGQKADIEIARLKRQLAGTNRGEVIYSGGYFPSKATEQAPEPKTQNPTPASP